MELTRLKYTLFFSGYSLRTIRRSSLSPSLFVRCALGVLVVTAILGPALPGLSIGGANIFLFRLLAIPLLVLTTLFVVLRENGRFQLSTQELLFCGFGFYLSLLLLSAPSLTSGLRSVTVIILPIATALVLVLSVQSREDINFYGRVLLALLCLSLIIALWEILTGNHLSTSRIPSLASHYSRRTSAWYYNSNDYSAILAILSPLVLIKLLYGDIHERIFALLLSLGISTIMIQNAPRAASAAILVSSAACIIPYLFRKSLRVNIPGLSRVLFIVPLVGCLLIPLATLFIGDRIPSFEKSILVRFQLLRVAAQTAVETFIGAGLGSFQVVAQQTSINTMGVLSPHSWLTWILAVTGFPGLILFSLLIGIILKNSIAKYLSTGDPLSLGTFGMLVAFSIAGLGPSNVFHLEGIWLILGYLVAASRPPK